MYMRLFSVKVNYKLIPDYIKFYSTKAMPELENAKGCHFAGLLENLEDQQQLISMTLWDDPQNSTTFEQSDIYKGLLEENKTFLAESSDLDFGMTDDLPIVQDSATNIPEISTYDITAQTDLIHQKPGDSEKMNVRILSLKIKPEKLKEFENIYFEKIIPEIKKIQGLRYDFLTESILERSEIISITIWDNIENLDEYLIKGQFRNLLSKLEHTLLEIEEDKYFSEEKYYMITGKIFSNK